MTQVSLWDNNLDEKVFVLAGILKSTQRQLYISTYEDCDDWSISVVPSIMTRDKATRLIQIAKDSLEKKKRKIPEFEIVPATKFPEIARLLGYKI